MGVQRIAGAVFAASRTQEVDRLQRKVDEAPFCRPEVEDCYCLDPADKPCGLLIWNPQKPRISNKQVLADASDVLEKVVGKAGGAIIDHLKDPPKAHAPTIDYPRTEQYRYDKNDTTPKKTTVA